MTLKSQFTEMIESFDSRFAIPRIAGAFFPPFRDGGQQTDEQFMAIVLEGGATGISVVLMPAEAGAAHTALRPQALVGKQPQEFALAFGSDDPVTEMLGLASINAICQYVMTKTEFPLDYVTNPMGLLSIEEGDRVGMVGLFSGLVPKIRKTGAELVIIEKNERLVEQSPALPVTADVSRLEACNKVLCTGATVLNNTLDDVLSHCAPDAFVSVVGPSAGYFPDPLFAAGVDVVGGRVVTDSEAFVQRLIDRKPWTDTTQKTCFQKTTYTSVLDQM